MFADMDTFWAILNKFEIFGLTVWTTLKNFEKKKIGKRF